jgi:hypothetical protein
MTARGASYTNAWDTTPDVLALLWQPGDIADLCTKVTLSFCPVGHQRTRVELCHAGWPRDRLERYVDHQRGWDEVLIDGYQAYVHRLVDSSLDLSP